MGQKVYAATGGNLLRLVDAGFWIALLVNNQRHKLGNVLISEEAINIRRGRPSKGVLNGSSPLVVSALLLPIAQALEDGFRSEAEWREELDSLPVTVEGSAVCLAPLDGDNTTMALRPLQDDDHVVEIYRSEEE